MDEYLVRQLLWQQLSNPNQIDEKLKNYLIHQLRMRIYSFIPLDFTGKELAKRWGIYDECEYNLTRFSEIYLRYLCTYPNLLEKLGTDKKILCSFLENKILNSPHISSSEFRLAQKFGLDTSRVIIQEINPESQKELDDDLVPF